MLHLLRFPSAAARIVLGLTCVVLSQTVSARAEEYRVGVSFVENGQSCVGEILNYGTDVQLHIFAYVPPGTEMNGAVLSLELPPGIFLRQRHVPRDMSVKPEELTAITSSGGVDVTFPRCPVTSGPVLLISHDIYRSDGQYDGGTRVPDLAVWLGGGKVEADSLLEYERSQV